MINIVRAVQVPASLDTQEIKDYIDQLVLHLADPNVHPKPVKPPSYRTSDLLAAFDEQFHSKCYLTEERFQSSWEMDVEHFIPQSERPDLRYAWTNVFPCSHRANQMKFRTTPAGGYLNPCDVTENVETAIMYTLSTMGSDPRFEAVNVADQKSVNTARLLDRVHNGHDETSINATKGLRHAIQKKYSELLLKIIDWSTAVDAQERAQAERELRDLVSRKSSFTMLCRSIPAVRQNISGLFD